jgi:hypothetical protein
MEYVYQGLNIVLQPFVQKTFDYFLGDLIDSDEIDLRQLSVNGIKDLQLDAEKINKKFF